MKIFTLNTMVVPANFMITHSVRYLLAMSYQCWVCRRWSGIRFQGVFVPCWRDRFLPTPFHMQSRCRYPRDSSCLMKWNTLQMKQIFWSDDTDMSRKKFCHLGRRPWDTTELKDVAPEGNSYAVMVDQPIVTQKLH